MHHGGQSCQLLSVRPYQLYLTTSLIYSVLPPSRVERFGYNQERITNAYGTRFVKQD